MHNERLMNVILGIEIKRIDKATLKKLKIYINFKFLFSSRTLREHKILLIQFRTDYHQNNFYQNIFNLLKLILSS